MKKAITFLFVSLLAGSAWAQKAGSGAVDAQIGLNASDMGLSAAALTATQTSSTLITHGFNQLTINVIAAQSGCTRVDMYIEATEDSTNWSRVQTQSISSGAATLSDLSYRKTIAAADNWIVNIPINYSKSRLVFTCGAGTAAAGDTVTVHGVFGNI